MRKAYGFQSEFVFNMVLVILGLLIMIGSYGLGFGTLKNPGSGLFPFITGLLVLVPNVISLFKVELHNEEIRFTLDVIKKLLSMAAVFIMWLVLMPLLGYVAVTFLATFLFSKVMGLEGLLKPVLLSIGTTGACYLFFDYILYSDLPRGFGG